MLDPTVQVVFWPFISIIFETRQRKGAKQGKQQPQPSWKILFFFQQVNTGLLFNFNVHHHLNISLIMPLFREENIKKKSGWKQFWNKTKCPIHKHKYTHFHTQIHQLIIIFIIKYTWSDYNFHFLFTNSISITPIIPAIHLNKEFYLLLI